MMAALGNHVRTLQRVAVGPLPLGDLPAGAWRVLESHEVDTLRAAALATKAQAKAAAKAR